MRLLDLATRTPISDAVGWTVFHSLWERHRHCGGSCSLVSRGSFAAYPVRGRVPRIARHARELYCHVDSFSAGERQRRRIAC